MKVAITARGESPEAQVAPRFSRCNYFAVIDMEQEQWEFLPNPRLSPEGRACSYVVRKLTDRKVIIVLTGSVGPNAFAALQAAGIEVYSGVNGTVREVFDFYRKGQLVSSTQTFD